MIATSTMLRVRGLPAVLAMAIGVIGVSAWNTTSAGSAPDAGGHLAVRHGTLVRTHTVSGELVAVQSLRVAVPRFRERSAVPIQAMAPDGAAVKPGDLLLQVDNANLNTKLSADVLALDKAESDLARKTSEEEARIKDREIERARLLLEMKKAALKADVPADLMPLREWQDHQFARERATREYQQADRALTLARRAAVEETARLRILRDQIRGRIDISRRDVEALRVIASTAGTVVYEQAPLTWNSGDQARRFQVGDQVSPGMVVMTVADLADLEARIHVSEVDGGLVRPGMPARITLDSGEGDAVTGRLTSMREVAERQRRLSNVRVFVGTVALDRTDRRVMKPGMSVRVELTLGEHKGLIAPRSAVFTDGTRSYVRRASGERQQVAVIARTAAACVLEGLAEGDTIARIWQGP